MKIICKAANRNTECMMGVATKPDHRLKTDTNKHGTISKVTYKVK